MSLYYDRDSGRIPVRRPAPPQSQGSGMSWTAFGILTIACLAALQGAGFLHSWEHGLIRACSPRWITPPRPAGHLLIIGAPGCRKGLPPMDLALLLRGLSRMGPSKVYFDGRIAPGQDRTLLDGILTDFRAKTACLMQEASPSFHPVPMAFYDPLGMTPAITKWPRVEGAASNTGGCFFPESHDPSSLPLFARLPGGLVAGSLWWSLLHDALPKNSREPVWVMGGSFLLIGDSTPLRLTGQGVVSAAFPGRSTGSEFQEISAEDFLLQSEMADRGHPDPAFQSPWHGADVLITDTDAHPQLSLLASLRDDILWKRLPLLLQGCLALFWIVLFLILRQALDLRGRTMAAMILGCATVCWIATFLHAGVMVPFLPPLAVILFLILPGRLATVR